MKYHNRLDRSNRAKLRSGEGFFSHFSSQLVVSQLLRVSSNGLASVSFRAMTASIKNPGQSHVWALILPTVTTAGRVLA